MCHCDFQRNGKFLTVDRLGQGTLILCRKHVCAWMFLGSTGVFERDFGMHYVVDLNFGFLGLLHLWISCQIGEIFLSGKGEREVEVERLSRPQVSDCFLLCIQMWSYVLGLRRAGQRRTRNF